jgi:SAM-dependent methyltransferase
MLGNLTTKIKKRNSKVSDTYAGTGVYWWRSPSNILLKRNTEKFLDKYSKGSKVLDAGAGRLAYKNIVGKYFDEYVSTDFKKTHDDLTAVADIAKQPFKNSELDFVFCSQVLEHVPHPWQALEEFHRILKKGGRCLITVPMLGYIHNAPYDFYRYTEFGLKQLAKDAGFKVLEVKPIGGFFSFLGYIRSTIISPLYSIPVLGKLVIALNIPFALTDIFLDKLTGNSKIFPLNYIIILEK